MYCISGRQDDPVATPEHGTDSIDSGEKKTRPSGAGQWLFRHSIPLLAMCGPRIQVDSLDIEEKSVEEHLQLALNMKLNQLNQMANAPSSQAEGPEGSGSGERQSDELRRSSRVRRTKDRA
jgi:hypothetical protein